MTTDKLIDLVMYMANDKAKETTELMYQFKPASSKRYFYHGMYMAFNEIYSMMKNIKDGIQDTSK